MKKTIANLLKELKIALTLWLVSVIICFIACYAYRDVVYNIVTEPITTVFNKNYSSLFVYTSLFESFAADIALSLYSAILVTVPILLICIYWFFAKSLYPSEKRTFSSLLVLSFVLTSISVVVIYFFLLPHFIVFFTFNVNNAIPMLKISDYISTFFHLIFIISLVFQFPIILVVLSKFGFIKNDFLKKHRKLAIVIIFIISAIITPPDVASQIIIATILIIIYEITNFFVQRSQNQTMSYNKNARRKNIVQYKKNAKRQ